MGQVGRCPLQAVSVVDLPLAGLHINIEVLEVIVKVHGSGTEMSSQHCGMCGEHCGHIHLPQPQHDQGDSRHPLMEMSHHLLTSLVHLISEVSNELGHHEAENEDIIALIIEMRNPDLSLLVEFLFPGVEVTAS